GCGAVAGETPGTQHAVDANDSGFVRQAWRKSRKADPDVCARRGRTPCRHSCRTFDRRTGKDIASNVSEVDSNLDGCRSRLMACGRGQDAVRTSSDEPLCQRAGRDAERWDPDDPSL